MFFISFGGSPGNIFGRVTSANSFSCHTLRVVIRRDFYKDTETTINDEITLVTPLGKAKLALA